MLWWWALGCEPETTTPTTPTPPAPDYSARGPWEVGTAEIEIVGTDGIELLVQLWYPTAQETGEPLFYDGVLAGDAFAGAPPACAEPRPLLAFSHGSGGIRWQSPFLTEGLASHGYVVVAPDHPGNTFFDEAPDFEALVVRRPIDLRDAVDALLAAAAEPSSPYMGCVDPAAGYAVAGHSFGGYTALALAGATVNAPADGSPLSFGDDRVWAALALAPWDGAGAITDGTAEITVPTMILTGARDETTPLALVEGLWEPLAAEPRYLGVFPDAGHFSFSPVACLVETTDGCGEDFLAPGVFTPLVDAAAGGFLEGIRGVPRAAERIPLAAAQIEWTTVP